MGAGGGGGGCSASSLSDHKLFLEVTYIPVTEIDLESTVKTHGDEP